MYKKTKTFFCLHILVDQHKCHTCGFQHFRSTGTNTTSYKTMSQVVRINTIKLQDNITCYKYKTTSQVVKINTYL